MALGKSAAVGAFVLGAAGIAVVAILLFGGTRLFTNNLRVLVHFQDSVAGLTAGAPVTLRGVKVGTVRSMKVYIKLPNLVPTIPVYLEIEPGQVSWTTGSLGAGPDDFQLAVKAGLRAQLVTQSLVTGQLNVDLDFHPDTPATVIGSDDGVPEIPSIPSDFQRMKNQITDLDLPDLTDKARVALIGIERVVGELTGRIGPVASSIQQTSDAARETLEATTAAVRQLQIDASHTLANIDRLANATHAQIAVIGKDADRLLATAGRAVSQAERVIASLHDLTGPNTPARGDVEATLRDLAASASSLRNFTRELERNPGGALLGRPAR